MTNMAKAAPVKAAGVKLYCQNCKHYSREATMRKEKNCKKLDQFVMRKNFCNLYE